MSPDQYLCRRYVLADSLRQSERRLHAFAARLEASLERRNTQSVDEPFSFLQASAPHACHVESTS